MAVDQEQSDVLTLIRLEGAVGIASAAELKKLLVQALGSDREVRVSLEAATDLDVTAVQLLWAARRDAKASGVWFSIEGQTEQVFAALLAAGFENFAATVDAGLMSEVIVCQP